MRDTINVLILALFIVISLSDAIAYGQATQSPAVSSGSPTSAWQFSVTPFLWATTITSDVTVGGYDTSTTTTFSDIWHDLNGAFMMHFEAKKGNFGFFLEPMYVKIRADSTLDRQRLPGLPAIPRDLTLNYEQWMVEAGGFYQAGRWPVGENKGQWATLDLLAGVRYWSINVDLDTSSIINPTRNNSWIDPIVGLRFTVDITKNILFNIRTDIGGFGVGSDFSWNGLGAFGYRFSDCITGLLGYRALYVDYKSGTSRARFEETIYGPVMGINFSF